MSYIVGQACALLLQNIPHIYTMNYETKRCKIIVYCVKSTLHILLSSCILIHHHTYKKKPNMIVFKTYVILIYVIVILSLKHINALYIDEDLREALLRRHECVQGLKKVFTGDDLREHAKIAINKFSKGKRMTSEIAGYYLSIEPHLRVGLIPTTASFCRNYFYPAECKRSLDGYYGNTPEAALINAYSNFERENMKQMFFKALPHNKTNLKFMRYKDMLIRTLCVDIALEYLDSILQHFELNIGENGMHGITNFCDDLHNLPPDEPVVLPGL